MHVLDPGHTYLLDQLDQDPCDRLPGQLNFVKREGPGYPGNVGHHKGTNIQEVLRALIDRVEYLNNQIPDSRNKKVIRGLRDAFVALELRAAERHNRKLDFREFSEPPEKLPYCKICGHVGHNCEGR